jgi:hypothetical protein
MEWTDDLWEQVWERMLDHVERHQVARAVRRREPPDDPLHRRLVPELARRWRRTARNQALFHLIWIAFWGAIARGADPAAGEVVGLAIGMAGFSLLTVLACPGMRRYLAPVARWTWG